MSGVKRKHVTLSLNEKLAVLQRLDKGESPQKIAKELNVGVTTLKDWRRNRKDIESYRMTIDGDNALKNRKTLKKPKLELLDNALWMWFCQERKKGALISGPILKEKATALHKKLETGSEFVASEGWIDRWKTRHGVRFVSISGEKLSADAEAAMEFPVKLATGPHAASDTSEIEYTDSEDDTEDELPETAPIDSLNPPAPKNVTNGWQGDELEKRMDEAYKILQCSVQKTKTKKDELDIYGQLVTEKLRKMDEETRDFARNKIDNMLFDLKRNHPFRNLSTQNTRTTASSSPSTSQQSFHQVFSSPPTSQLIQTSSSSSIK